MVYSSVWFCCKARGGAGCWRALKWPVGWDILFRLRLVQVAGACARGPCLRCCLSVVMSCWMWPSAHPGCWIPCLAHGSGLINIREAIYERVWSFSLCSRYCMWARKLSHRTLVLTCSLLGSCAFLRPSHNPSPLPTPIPHLPIQDLGA